MEIKPSPKQESELSKALKTQQHFEWLNVPFTKEFFSKLNERRNELQKEVENLSLSFPRNNDIINNKLVESATIRKIIETYATHR